jgi:hypothetical protein
MEGDMLDYATLTLSAHNLGGNARAKAVRVSYEFWSTGTEALLEHAFAEIFVEHAVRPLGETTGSGSIRRLGALEKGLEVNGSG